MGFYTYIWLREDGTPYYVGKGMGNRAFKKRRLGHSPPSERVLIQEFPSESDAFAAEKFLIAFYGREDLGLGSLLNLTDGGENPPSSKGRTMPPELRRQIGDRFRGNKTWLGRHHSVESKAKISRAHKGKQWALGRHHSPETIEKIRRSNILSNNPGKFQPGHLYVGPWRTANVSN